MWNLRDLSERCKRLPKRLRLYFRTEVTDEDMMVL